MADFFKVLTIMALVVMAGLFFVLLVLVMAWGAILILVGLFAIYGWMLYAFFYYRFCRREELLYLLANAAESEVPLAPVLRAYLQDRPHGTLRDFWLATILCVLPIPGFYWIWYRRYNFDRKVEELARHLELGVPLYHALQHAPALATRETVLAAAIGESTGQLPRCLRSIAQRRLSAVWMELIPQLVYPVVMLAIIFCIVSFLNYFIVPKFKRIFADFGVEMPGLSKVLMFQSDFTVDYAIVFVLGIQLLLLMVAVLAFSPTARWFFPGLGSVYRRLVRCHLLQMLSLMLQTGKPVSESLAVLAGMPIGIMAQRLIDRARFRIEQGEPFAESLTQAGLLSAAMLPLVQSAQRTDNLPWALTEMAQSLNSHTVRTVERVTQAVFPLTVILLGALVGFIVIAMFLPLVRLITELAG